MTNSKLLPGGLIAVAALLSGLTVATAQTAPETAPVKMETSANAQDHTRGDCGKAHKDHGKRGGHEQHGGRGGRGGPGMMVGQVIKKADANNDRAVTQVEIDTFRAAAVANADVSGEGEISIDEFETIYLQLIRNQMVDTFQDLDEDGDGVVTQVEMDKRFGNVVERMDRNDDGQLDREDRPNRGHKGKGPRHD